MKRLSSIGAALFLAGAAQAADEGVAPASPIPADAQIVFVSTRDGEKDHWGLGSNALYVANLAGRATRITHSKFFHNHFVVAPNRRLIATNRYSRGDTNKDGKYFPLNDYKELWIVDTVTGKERRIIPDIDAGWGGLSWSPDSKWVYFSSPTEGRGMDIRRVNVETEAVQVLTGDLLQKLGLPDGKKFVSDVGASQDGKWIVFLFTGPDMLASGKSKTRIAILKLDGSEARIVTDGGPLPPGRRGDWSVGDFDPEFSPDSKAISFARVSDRAMTTARLSVFDVWTINTDGTGLKAVSPLEGNAAEYIPGWGDNGKIIFTRLDPVAQTMAPVVYDPKTGVRTPISIGGEGGHVQWIPSGAK